MYFDPLFIGWSCIDKPYHVQTHSCLCNLIKQKEVFYFRVCIVKKEKKLSPGTRRRVLMISS